MPRKVSPEDRLEFGVHLNLNRWLAEQIQREAKLKGLTTSQVIRELLMGHFVGRHQAALKAAQQQQQRQNQIDPPALARVMQALGGGL
jgi:hypothetical protein